MLFLFYLQELILSPPEAFQPGPHRFLLKSLVRMSLIRRILIVVGLLLVSFSWHVVAQDRGENSSPSPDTDLSTPDLNLLQQRVIEELWSKVVDESLRGGVS